MKTVYFVRHGESEGNAGVGDVYLGRKSPLTEKGREQAKLIAERAARIPFDVLISSPWVRAQETALEIARRTGKDVELSELFTERRAPASVLGLPLNDANFVASMRSWNASIFSHTERFEDGENFADLKMRAHEALRFLRSRAESTILVATHGLFLRVLLAYVLIGDSLSGDQFQHFVASTKTDNTGITILTYGQLTHHESDASERWRVRVFNDHAHLG